MLHVPTIQRPLNQCQSCTNDNADTKRRGGDQQLNATMGQVAGGISPTALARAHSNWARHLLLAPDKQHELFASARHQWSRCVGFCLAACAGCLHSAYATRLSICGGGSAELARTTL